MTAVIQNGDPFMKLLARVFSLLLLLAPVAVLASGALVNARIHVLDESLSVVEAMAWDDEGRIVFVGSTDELLRKYPGVAAMNARGQTVVPGLIDAHGHVMGLGLSRLNADLMGAGSVAEVVERLQQHAETIPEEGWLIGRGWDQTLWEGAQFPQAADLDAAFPDRPVWLTRVDGHAGWANTAALALVDRDLSGDWQPEGGVIHRNEAGQPIGVLIDKAMGLVRAIVPEPSPAQRERALDLAQRELAALGLTGVHDMGASLEDFELYTERARAGKLTVRITAQANGDGALLAWLCEQGRQDGPMLKAHGVKLYADGALGSRGAALDADYSDDAGNRGLLLYPDAALAGLVNRIMGCGLQLSIHAIGDAATHQVVEALIAAQEQHATNPGRHRIEHAQVMQLEDIARMAEHGLIASMQPTHATSDMRWAEDRLGAERLAGAYAWQRMLKAGVALALGSDFPVEPANPWLGVHAAVTRQRDGEPEGGWRPEERLSLLEALRGFTAGAANAGFAEEDLGSLEVGKWADFIVLEVDPFAVPADELAEMRVITTVVGGKVVYLAGAAASP